METRSRPEPVLPQDGGLSIMIGSPRTGKTGLAARATNWHVLNEDRYLVVLDPTGDVRKWHVGEYGVPAEEYAVVQTYEECWNALEGSWRDLHYGKSIVYFQNPDRVEVARLSSEWLRVVNCRRRDSERFKKGSFGFVFLCDEAELVFPNNRLDDERMTAVKLCGNVKHTMYLTSQYPQILSAYVRGLAFNVCVFNAGNNELFIENGCRVWGPYEMFQPAGGLRKYHYLYRPKYRIESDTELEELHSMKSRMPWLEDEQPEED